MLKQDLEGECYRLAYELTVAKSEGLLLKQFILQQVAWGNIQSAQTTIEIHFPISCRFVVDTTQPGRVTVLGDWSRYLQGTGIRPRFQLGP